MHLFWLRARRFFFVLSLLLLYGGSVVFSQSFAEIRNCLVLRDRLAVLKGEAESLVAADIDVEDLRIKGKPAQIESELGKIETEANAIRGIKGPLADYYLSLIDNHIGGVKAVLPVIQKRLKRETPKAHPAAPTEVALQIPVSPPEIPQNNTTSMPFLGNTSHGRASASEFSKDPAVDFGTAALVIPPEPAPIEQDSKARRKMFFHPIWPRLLLVRKLNREPGKPPIAAVPAPEKPGVSVASSLTPRIPVSAELPKPVSVAPTAVAPITPSPGPDPQVRQSPGMRPLAVMIENHNQARPQTGIGEAEVVYEIPVEGGITRFMALFYHVAGVIGPIRSCRDYFIDRALEVNALYVHCGGSPQGYNYIGESMVFAVDEISNGTPFYRDNTRKAPHNLYSRVKSLIDSAHQKHPMVLPYQKLPLLYGRNPTYGVIPVKGVAVQYHGNYSLIYRFNNRYNVYDRYMNGQQHLDRVTLRPVSPGTVIIQEAFMKVIDDKGRQDISFIGEGNAYIMAGGTLIKAYWKKTAPREFTKFFDESGRPVVFSSAHPIWVQVVSPKNAVAFDPPLAETLPKANQQATAASHGGIN